MGHSCDVGALAFGFQAGVCFLDVGDNIDFLTFYFLDFCALKKNFVLYILGIE